MCLFLAFDLGLCVICTTELFFFYSNYLILLLGFFLLLAIVLYVIWLHVMDVVSLYVDFKQIPCKDFKLNILYGLSFMFAPVGVFFCLLSGLLFLLIARTVRIHYNSPINMK